MNYSGVINRYNLLTPAKTSKIMDKSTQEAFKENVLIFYSLLEDLRTQNNLSDKECLVAAANSALEAEKIQVVSQIGSRLDDIIKAMM